MLGLLDLVGRFIILIGLFAGIYYGQELKSFSLGLSIFGSLLVSGLILIALYKIVILLQSINEKLSVKQIDIQDSNIQDKIYQDEPPRVNVQDQGKK